MNKEYSFENMPEDPEKPIIGIYQRLFEAEKRKKLEREQARSRAVDKSLLIDEPTVSQNEPVSPQLTVSQNEPVPIGGTVTPNGPVPKRITVPINGRGNREEPDISDDTGYVTIKSNFMILDMDVFKALRDMTFAERAIYLDLIRRAYGAYPDAKNICSCTYTDLAKTSGINSRDSISRTITVLESKNYIKRLFIAFKRGDSTIYRVYLPCEINGSPSRTRLIIEKEINRSNLNNSSTK